VREVSGVIEISDLIKDRGLHISATSNPPDTNLKTIKDSDGFRDLLWQHWGQQLKIKDGSGYLIYIPDSELENKNDNI
jgi:hypothetical protein